MCSFCVNHADRPIITLNCGRICIIRASSLQLVCLMGDDRGPIIIPAHSLGLVATCRIWYIVDNLAQILNFYKNLADGQIAVK